MTKTKFRFSIFGLSHRPYGESEEKVEVGSEDPLQIIFRKGIFVQDWRRGTHFDRGQFGIKTLPMNAHPNVLRYAFSFCRLLFLTIWKFLLKYLSLSYSLSSPKSLIHHLVR